MMSPVLIVFALAAAAPPKPRATPTPAPPPVIEGTVKGPDGKPVDKALVLAQAERGGFPFAAGPNPPISTRTDAAGAFRLEVKGRGPHTVRVEAAGLAPATLDRIVPPAKLPVTLVKGGAIDGIVRDGNTGSPLARIVVEAREERRGVSVQWDADAGSARAQSDEQGRFRIEGLAVGLHGVSARTRGFDSGSRGAVRTGSRVDLYLFPGSAVTGTVRDVEGRPIAKAVVRAQGDAMPFRFTASNTAASSDTEGRFEIPGLSSGRYRLVARAPEFAQGTVTDVVVERGADAEADVVLYRGASVSGRLTGPNETTVPGRVTVHEEDASPLPLGMDDALAAEAGADGRFRVERVAPGSLVVAVVAPGYASQRLPVEVGTAGNPVDLGDIPLEAGLTIRGRVRDGGGLPIADAQINGFNRGAGMGGGFGNMVSGRGEADGTFVLAGVAPGTYRLTARAQGYGEGTKTVASGSEGVDFVLDAAGAITGIVVDEAGRAVDSFRAMARPVVEEMGIRMAPRLEMVGDAEGRFTLDNLSPGTYLVQVTAPDRADGIVSNVKVASGATVDVGRVRLGAGGIVRGTVADGTGTPILGATVTVRSGGSQSFGPNTGGEAVSDTGGAFEVRGVPVGSAMVTGRHPNYAEGSASGVEVDPTKGAAEVRLVLTQGGRMEGSVTRRDGSGVPNVMVQVVPRQPGGGISFPSDTMRTTGADGRFAVEHLPVGRVNVTLMLGGGGQFQAGPTKDVEVQEGETAVAEFVSREILVTGRVTRGGAPAANMRVNVRGERNMGMFLSFNASPVPAQPTGPQRGTAVTREDGSYELLVDDAGKYQANAVTMDTRVRYPERPVDVPDADTFALDLNYNGVPVTGIVVDRETEQPVPDVGLYASPKEPERKGTPGGGGTTGADGRFVMELEPGEYNLGLHAEGYASESSELTVGAGGSSDVRVTLSRGSMISGRLVDEGGRPVGGVFVGAQGFDASERPQWGGGAPTLPDGSFQLARLNAAAYTLTAQSSDGRFAMRRGISPGQKDVTLTLRPGGQVQLLVRGPDGAPVEGAYARIAQLDGAKLWIGGGPQTNAQGTTEVNVPAGQVELEVNKDNLQGRTTVAVPAGGSVPAEIMLAERAAGTNRP